MFEFVVGMPTTFPFGKRTAAKILPSLPILTIFEYVLRFGLYVPTFEPATWGIIATFPVGSRVAPMNVAPGKNEFESVRVKGLYVAIFAVALKRVNITIPVGKSTG